MEPSLPFWFKQRQAKAENVKPDVYRLTGPNLGEAFVAVRIANDGRWSAHLMENPDGPDLAATPAEFPDPVEAYAAAFELFRVNRIV